MRNLNQGCLCPLSPPGLWNKLTAQRSWAAMWTTHSLSLKVSPLWWWHPDSFVPFYPVPPNLPQYTVLKAASLRIFTRSLCLQGCIVLSKLLKLKLRKQDTNAAPPSPSTQHQIVPESPAFATAAGNTFVLVKICSLCSRHLEVWDVEEAQPYAPVACFLFQTSIPFLQN